MNRIELSLIIANQGLHLGDNRKRNSIEAVQSAARAGLGGVKVDVAIVGGIPSLHDSVRDGGEHLGRVTQLELQHMTGREIPSLRDLLDTCADVPIILELHQSALVDMAEDVLADMPEHWMVASLDHRAVLRCAEEHGCKGILMMAHRPLPGTIPSIPHRLVDTIAWRSWPTWPDDIETAGAAGWRSLEWNDVLPEDAVKVTISKASAIIADLLPGWDGSH